jgi:hypothetical protein
VSNQTVRTHHLHTFSQQRLRCGLENI